MITIKLECLDLYIINFKLTEYSTLTEFFSVIISLVPMCVSFNANAILEILTIFLIKILCWKTAAAHQRIIMLDEWDEDNEQLAMLEPVGERAGSTSFSPIIPSVAVLVEWFPEWRTEKNEKHLSVLSRWVDERIKIWAPLSNSEERKASLRDVSCVFLYLVL